MRELAAELGFLAAGVAELDASPRAEQVRAFFEQGMHGEMDYLSDSAEDRIDPRRRFPWARRAIVLATPYEAPAGPPSNGTTSRIAAYARGRDYHKLLDQRTRALGRRLEAELDGLQWRAYVDTGPLLERELAERAGLGWIGKHGLLLSERFGSYVLLSVLLVSAELTPTERREPDGCASCRACLDACPTDAFVAPQILDPRRCLSYQTIERRGPIEALDPAGYVFGCDLCQIACPYNAAAPEGDPGLAAYASHDTLRLADLVDLDEPAYQEAFRASAVKRATRAGLRRNAMWLALRTDDQAALTATARATEDPDPTVARTARDVLAERSER